jgi:NADH:ubiquinone oxidoreductase subunit 6 (subunit J)
MGSLGFVFALGVALFPCQSDFMAVRIVHFASAVLLFGVFVFFSLVLFTKTHEDKEPSSGKKNRNVVYWVCGLAIVLFLLLIALSFIFLTPDQRNAYKLIFWFESAALWAFGISWLVKGRLLWSSLLG